MTASCCCALVAILLFFAAQARAHPLEPVSVIIREQGARHYRVAFRRSELALETLRLSFPAGCQVSARGAHADGDQRTEQLELVCSHELEGQTLRIFGLTDLGLSALVYLELASGARVRGLLAPYQTSFVVPTRASSWSVLRDYVALGAEHLVTGADHVLFVVGLLLLVHGLRRRICTLSAFTLGHSLTLGLSTFSIIELPSAPVEICIAASLLMVALEILAQRAPASDSERAAKPWLMAGAFGLLHGLGFASALADTGLPLQAIPLALLGFNLGVEAAQVAIVLAVVPGLKLVRSLPTGGRARLRVLTAYGIGSLAALWCIERAVPLF